MVYSLPPNVEKFKKSWIHFQIVHYSCTYTRTPRRWFCLSDTPIWMNLWSCCLYLCHCFPSHTVLPCMHARWIIPLYHTVRVLCSVLTMIGFRFRNYDFWREETFLFLMLFNFSRKRFSEILGIIDKKRMVWIQEVELLYPHSNIESQHHPIHLLPRGSNRFYKERNL